MLEGRALIACQSEQVGCNENMNMDVTDVKTDLDKHQNVMLSTGL